MMSSTESRGRSGARAAVTAAKRSTANRPAAHPDFSPSQTSRGPVYMLKSVTVTALSLYFMGVAAGQDLQPASEWAATVFSEYRVAPNITYKKAHGHDIKLDVITAGGSSQIRPTVIYLH